MVLHRKKCGTKKRLFRCRLGKRKYVILAIFVLAAILTPPDVVSQVALGLPMCGLYEIGILVSRCTKARERA